MKRRLLAVLAVLLSSMMSGCSKPEPRGTGEAAPTLAASATSLAITVDGSGYHPATASAPPGKPVRLVFTRTSDAGCGQKLVFPTLGIRKDLPLNEAVPVDVTMPASGQLAFTCGMNMYRGAIVAQ